MSKRPSATPGNGPSRPASPSKTRGPKPFSTPKPTSSLEKTRGPSTRTQHLTENGPHRTENSHHASRPLDRAEISSSAPHGAHWLWGTHAVEAALANPERKILRLVATAETADSLKTKFAETDQDLHHTPDLSSRDDIARLLPPGAVHQGIALLVKPLKQLVIEDLCDRVIGNDTESALVVLLDQVTDPHNVGAIMRSAAAFGALGVVVPDRNAPDVSGVLAKSASGAVETIPLVRTVNLVRALEMLKKAGFWVVGLDGTAERSLASHALQGKIALILGGEGDGLRRLTREKCDFVAKLPMKGPIESLNVSNAAAIALYELTRTP